MIVELTDEEVDFLQDCVSGRCDQWSVLDMEHGTVTEELLDLSISVAQKLGMEVGGEEE